MTTTKHTPGPWGCCDTSYHAHDYRLTRPDGTPLPVNAPYNDHSEQRANARLIAEAPEMETAIRDAVSASDANDGDSLMNAIENFRAILARIDGEAR